MIGEQKGEQMKYKTFAIDFDGTIVDKEQKTLLPHADRIIKRIRESGGQVAIWTCRTGEYAEEAKQFLKQHSIEFDSFNSTIPFVKEKWGNCGRKIWAEVYIDDSSIHCRNGVDWLEIEKILWE